MDFVVTATVVVLRRGCLKKKRTNVDTCSRNYSCVTRVTELRKLDRWCMYPIWCSTTTTEYGWKEVTVSVSARNFRRDLPNYYCSMLRPTD